MELDKDLPFETLLKIEETVGSKSFQKVHAAKSKKEEVKTLLPKFRAQDNDSDDPPEEIAIMKKAPKRAFVRQPKESRAAISIDPRFNPRAGKYNAEQFRRNFDFAFELKEKELTELKKLATPTNSNPEEKEKAKYLVQRMENQKREEQKKQQNKMKPIINKNGSKYFPSKNEVLAQELVSKYVELKNSGQLQTHLEKRRKKQSGKERKRMDIEKS